MAQGGFRARSDVGDVEGPGPAERKRYCTNYEGLRSQSQHNVVDEFRLLAYSRCKDTQKRSLTLAVDVQRHKRRTNSAR
jgi:hypothetical protein